MNYRNKMRYVKYNGNREGVANSLFNQKEATKAITFHRSFPDYSVTPLTELKHLAASWKVRNIYVKDESYRFGQNAFKVLGGSYAIGNYIAKKLDLDIAELTYEKITSQEMRDQLGELTFVTATDGNHGRGVAWTANRLQQHCVVYMPKGSSPERLANISALGAEALITELNYDDTVRLAAENARKQGWVLLQDTSWAGYEEIPAWIMQGYMTMILEAIQQLDKVMPTHVFLQAGVGAMAGSITGFLADIYSKNKPVITIVEPERADCLFQTAQADDGTLHMAEGSLATIMAGLACGEPCSIGWEVLSRFADCFVSMPDQFAAQGMRILGNPLPDDPKVISGESGAAAFGLVAEMLRGEQLEALKKDLGMNENSVILCISTEGDTDRENYRRIVWDGAYPAEC